MNDAKFSECKFSADIVPYMYGELSVRESSVFESHLLECGECTDEFAAVSNSRYEVYEWKKLEFDPLATPSFEIPYEAEKASSAGVSWVEKLRVAFASGWAIPSVAFAGIAIVAVFGTVLLRPGDVGPVVVMNDNANTPATPVSPVEREVDEVIPAEAKTERTSGKSLPDAVRIKSTIRTESRQAVRNLKYTRPRSGETRGTSARNQNAPRLNGFSEDEDTSLRLAELFEDVETSD